MEAFIGLTILGLAIGAYGTLIGAGGGFILMPLLLLVYPKDPPQTLAAISLIVVFFNAASGSLAYARMKRIDYRSGLLFSSVGIPGAILGKVIEAISDGEISIGRAASLLNVSLRDIMARKSDQLPS